MKDAIPFHDRILPALRGKGFRQEEYWVWCGSVTEGEDGRFHMFAARWPKKYPFFHGSFDRDAAFVRMLFAGDDGDASRVRTRLLAVDESRFGHRALTL